MDAFCATAINPFCNCYKKTPHFDISSASCQCITFDEQAFCDQAAAASYDCSALTSSVASICVGVR